MKAILMLEDGKGFYGEALGPQAEVFGEVILNTAVVGYQEMATDPANAGKILVLTYPLIGNYGVAPKFNESRKAWLAALVIKEDSRIFSNWQAKASLGDFIKKHNLAAIHSIDTRTLAVHLRNKGEMAGIISTKTFAEKDLLAKLRAFKKEKRESQLNTISVAKQKRAGREKGKHKIALLDLGITNSLLKQLETLGLNVTIFPHNTSAEEILRIRPKGLIISNGPEADSGLEEVARNIKLLVGKLPILAISTGLQVLAKSLGRKIIKLKLGHRGVNYPVQSPLSFKGEITAQNHGFVIDADSLRKINAIKITSYNLNDRTIEEIESKKLKIIGTQYLPVSPGFDEIHPVFNRFLKGASLCHVGATLKKY